MSEEQRLAQTAVVGRHRPRRASLGELGAEAQEGDVCRLAVSVGAGCLDVGAFDEPDVHTGAGQRIGVVRRAHQVRLHGGAKPIGQAVRGDGEDARLHVVGDGSLFGADLHAPANRQVARDGREASGRGLGPGPSAKCERSTDSHTSAGGGGKAATSSR